MENKFSVKDRVKTLKHLDLLVFDGIWDIIMNGEYDKVKGVENAVMFNTMGVSRVRVGIIDFTVLSMVMDNIEENIK